MDHLRELYQEVILDHNKSPRNCRAMEAPDRQAEGYNPLCGDRLTLYITLDGDVITDVSFEGSGCAISTASASMLTEAVKGKTLAEAEQQFKAFHRLTTEGDMDEATLGKLTIFAGVQEFPMRVKCATLSWHTLKSALENQDTVAKTE